MEEFVSLLKQIHTELVGIRSELQSMRITTDSQRQQMPDVGPIIKMAENLTNMVNVHK